MNSWFIEEARALGFVSVGFSTSGRPPFFDRFCEWTAAGKYGEMKWLKRSQQLREDSGKLLKGCQTVVTLAYPYSSTKPYTEDGFCSARYTEPGKADYHDRLRAKAQKLSKLLTDKYPGTRTRVCVDSAPILERSFAYASGIGFIGKNNMFIIPGYGSYIFLVEILADTLLPFKKIEPMREQCGSCFRCLKACPTGALEAPFSIDASRCLSYLTIEHPESVNSEIGKKMGECFLGCDRCQEACPFNEGSDKKNILLPHTDEILEMDEKDFEKLLSSTAFERVGLTKLKENIRAIRSTSSLPG